MHDDLLRRIRSGHDPEALARLFELDQAGIYHFLHRRLGHREDAEDATQEVFRRVILSLPSLREPGGYRGWLYRIALRVAQTQIQARIGERRRVETLARTASLTGTTDMAHFSPDENRSRLKAALEALDEELRTVVLLRYEQGLSYEEIAEATQRPLGTVSKRLHTAHQKLQQALAAAGFSLAMGALGEALASPVREAMPQELAARLKQMALEAPSRPASLSLARLGGITAVCFLAALFVGVPLIRRMQAARPEEPSSVARHALPERKGASAPPTPSSALRQNPAEARTAELADPAAAPSGILRGIVRDQETRAAIAGAAVWLENKGGPGEVHRVAETTTLSDGTFSLQAPAGAYKLDAMAPGYARHQFERVMEAYRVQYVSGETDASNEAADALRKSFEVRLESGIATERVFELTPAVELRGVVLDQRGLPIPESQIELYELQVTYRVPRAERVVEHSLSTTYEPDGRTSTYPSDLQGRFAISNVYPKGDVTLRVTRKGYQELKKVVALDRRSVEVTLVLERGTSFGGRVLSAGGQPIPEACLFLLAPEQSSPKALQAGNGGEFEATDQRGGVKFVAAFAPGYAPRLLDLSKQDPGGIQMVLSKSEEAAVSGLVTDESGRPLEGVSVVVHHYAVSTEGGRAQLVFTEKYDGGFSITAPGEYSAFLPDSYVAPRTASQADGAFRLEKLALAPGSQAFIEVKKRGYETLTLEAGAAPLQIRMQPKKK